MMRITIRALCGLLLLVPGCRRQDASEAENELAGGAITIWTDSTELFMEHPALIVGDSGKFAVHLTDLTDFAPLRSGRITLRFQSRGGGTPLVVTQEEPRAPGIYGPAPRFTSAGVYDLTILVDSPQARDSITVQELRVYASAEEAPRDEGGGDEGISFLKEQQWKTAGFRTAYAVSGTMSGTFSAPGTIGPAAGRYAEVAATAGGLVDATGLASVPIPGSRVSRGQVLAWLVPSLGEGGNATYAEARARLREAQDEHERARRLVDAEAAPARRLHEAEIRLAAAREALAGFGNIAEDGRIAIRSPLNGVVASRHLTPGSRVEAGTVLFTVVDPSLLWLTANVAAPMAQSIGRGSSATFLIDGDSRWRDTRALVSIGSIIDPTSRTLPVIYQVANPDGRIRIGALASVTVRTGTQETGVVIPASAIIEENGRPIVFVQAEGETFQRREVQLGPRTADRVLVRDGLKAGERIVTGSAYQVRLASLSTSVPAHGHEH
jgi:cobalt-zinc-cadmium efflux system membrane fusion protein